MIKQLRAILPAHAQEYVAAAFAGDPDAAASLMGVAPNNLRSEVIFFLYAACVPLPAFQAALRIGWCHDHHYLKAGISSPLLRAMFAHGGARPDIVPRKLTVWRGGRGDLAAVQRGWSWRTDRAIACFFATIWWVNQARGGPPLVVQASINGSRVVHTDDQIEAEMVIFGVRNAKVDGLLSEWRATADAHMIKRTS